MIQKCSVGEMIGVKSPSLLDSAVMRAQSSAFGEEAYPSIFEKVAALFESLGQNDLRFVMEPKAAEDLTADMVNHKYDFVELVSIIGQHSIPYKK